ncbi:Mth938-like domain-containing protein [Uliginosibacterium paludis]|uniref:MTH938/NDUFAF3 family protein n=1 Tax=Uliginosibacterium paludis TaxID=1615952 RepID=A0ABV2CQ61_9RHOO
MRLSKENAPGVTLIDAYDRASVSVAGKVCAEPVLIGPSVGVLPWAARGFDVLNAEDFLPVIELRPAVVLIGTGARQRFPAPAVLRHLIEARIGFEVMDTGSACRTYNLLAAEGRAVVAALLVGESM